MSQRKRAGGFSAIELIVLIAVVVILFILFRPGLYRSPPNGMPRIECVSNLKNIGLAFRIYATDNGDRFPAPSLSNEVAVAYLRAASHFAFLTNELSTPKILFCPADENRRPATNFVHFSRENISYFSSLNADETQPQLWLAGDRNLIINGKPADPGQILVSTNDQVGWTREIHADSGNILMADGSVQQLSANRLQQSLIQSGETNLLVFP